MFKKKKTRRVPFREFVAHGHHRLGFPTLQLLLAVQLSMSQFLPSLPSPFFGCQKSNTTIPHLIGSLDHLINKILRLYIPTTKTKVRRQHSLSLFVRRTSKFLLLPLAILFEPYLRPSISSCFVQVLISLTNDSLNRTFPSFCGDQILPSDVSPIVPRNPHCQPAIDLGQTMLQHVVIGARSF